MVQLPIRFLGITLHFMLCSVSGASTASIESTPHSPSLATANSTTESSPVSVFFLYMKITNRIFNESLKNQTSEDYKELRDELTQLLDDVYTSEPHNYTGITAMTFSEGSVVANTTLVFKTPEINPHWVKNQFLSYVKKNPPLNLDLNISYTEEQGIPLPDVGHQENATTGATIMTTTQSLKTATETTVNHTFSSPSGITNTETPVSETPPFTHNTSSMHDTTYFQSEHNTTNNVSALTDSIRSTAVTTNYPSEGTAITSNGTTESPTSESTQSQLTHSSKDSTTTSHPLSSSTINSITNFTTSLSISIGFTRNTTSSFPSSSTDNSSSDTSSPQIYNSSPTVHPPVNTSMTTVATSSQSHNTTIHSTDITSTTSLSITQSLPLASTTGHPINGTTNASESSTTMFATTSTPNSTSPHPNPVSTTQHASSLPTTTAHSSGPPLGTTTPNLTTRTTSEPHTSPTSSASASMSGTTTAAPGGNSQVVPGWAIALLVLASLILLFLILLFTALLVYWCCKRRQYDFMNMSEDPGIYDQANHGTNIPMFTTHSHYESTNGKPYEDAEKPTKNRTVYTVNKR